jgi:uncharacterized MAPEG superfamily protein
MTMALWCVAIAAILPIISTGIAKAGFRDYNNRQPREWLAKQQGWRARANAAQQNAWEALAVFAAGVFAAHIAQAPQERVDFWAMVFIGVRVAYLACYLADLAPLRSIVWASGFVISLSFFFF